MPATFRYHARKDGASSTQTFPNVPIGTASSNRLVVVFLTHVDFSESVDSMTIGGVSATRVPAGGALDRQQIWYANVPTGTTASIVITFSDVDQCSVHVWTGETSNITPIHYAQNSVSFGHANVSVSDGGFVIVGWVYSNTPTASVDWDFDWTGPDPVTLQDRQDDYQPSLLASGRYHHYQAAHIDPESTYATGDITFLTGTQENKCVFASWEGASVQTLDADKGTFTLTGVSAGLKKGSKLTAQRGVFTLSGLNAGLAAARKLPASKGTFTFTGFAATLSIAGVYSLGADRATFLLTGNDATLRVGRKLAAAQSEFVFTGVDSTLRKTHISLTAEQGAFFITGVETPLDYDAPAISEIYYNNNGTWVNVLLYVNDGGTWKIPTIYARHNGLWTIVQRE